MAALGVPTTRAGAVVTSDSRVVRDIFYSGYAPSSWSAHPALCCVAPDSLRRRSQDEAGVRVPEASEALIPNLLCCTALSGGRNPIQERCTVVTRIAPTFLRFGSFEIFKPTARRNSSAPHLQPPLMTSDSVPHIPNVRCSLTGHMCKILPLSGPHHRPSGAVRGAGRGAPAADGALCRGAVLPGHRGEVPSGCAELHPEDITPVARRPSLMFCFVVQRWRALCGSARGRCSESSWTAPRSSLRRGRAWCALARRGRLHLNCSVGSVCQHEFLSRRLTAACARLCAVLSHSKLTGLVPWVRSHPVLRSNS